MLLLYIVSYCKDQDSRREQIHDIQKAFTVPKANEGARQDYASRRGNQEVASSGYHTSPGFGPVH